jgi:hypothetical protein
MPKQKCLKITRRAVLKDMIRFKLRLFHAVEQE